MAQFDQRKNRKCVGFQIGCAPPSYPQEPCGTHAIRRQFGAAGRLFNDNIGSQAPFVKFSAGASYNLNADRLEPPVVLAARTYAELDALVSLQLVNAVDEICDVNENVITAVIRHRKPVPPGLHSRT